MSVFQSRKAQGVTTYGAVDPSHFLYGGESDIVTNRGTFAAGQVIAIGTVLMQTAAGYIIHDGTLAQGNAVAIAGDNINTSASGLNHTSNTAVEGPVWTGGQFNHEALIWPAALDTLGERRNAVAGTNIGVHRLP